jgi:signal transduction histidine kinase/ActR/RegA family two-component response regulator
MALGTHIREAWAGFTCANRDPQVVAGLTARLFATTAVGRFPPILCMLMLSLADYERTGLLLPAMVLLLHLFGSFALHDLRGRYYAKPVSTRDAIGWAWKLTALSAITGASWGLASVVWFNPASPEQSMLLGLMLVGVCTGSTMARSAFLPCAITHVSTACIPYLAMMAASGFPGAWIVCLSGALYLLWLVNSGRFVHADNVTTMYLIVENANLIASLTEARHAEAQSREHAELSRDAAEQANKAKSEFLAIVSHELRTPLNGILGMASVLCDGDLTEPQRNAVGTIRGAGEALSLVVDDLLDLTRLESGHTRLEPQETNLARLIDSVVQILRIRAWEKRLVLKTEISPEVPEFVLGDPGRLRQILINLAGNAVKFTDRGGVTIRARLSGEAANRLRIEVEDTGIGIPESAMDRLFKPFSQVDQSYTRAYGGTGLGLAIVKRLAALMHGDVGVDSQVGRGSLFWVDIPLLRADWRASPGQDRAASDRSSQIDAQFEEPTLAAFVPLKILVVDDSPHMRVMLRAVLCAGGHEVEEAHGGAEGLDRLARGGIDLVLLDLEMPGLDGAGTARLIRAMPDCAEMPVIGLTGHDESKVTASGLALAADLVLTKPVMPDVLLPAIQRVHGGRRIVEMASGPLLQRTATA